MKVSFLPVIIILLFSSCKKGNNIQPVDIAIDSVLINNNPVSNNGSVNGIDFRKVRIRIRFNSKIDTGKFDKNNLYLTGGIDTFYTYKFGSGSNSVEIAPSPEMKPLSVYRMIFDAGHNMGGNVSDGYTFVFKTCIDSLPKFPHISDDSLLTLIQKQTFRYFWDFGHPVSGMARERNSSGEIVTTGGTGFGIMDIPVAIERKFISKSEGLARVQTICDFLQNKAIHFHGAFSHWMNGTSGTVVPFGSNDNGADIVETSYMMMGLLTARQYFNGAGSDEIQLRNDIDSLWYHIEWDWFRKNGENILYWNWSPDQGWAVNVGVRGWNECLITYVLAASSPTHSIPKIVYDNGFASNGGIINNHSYYGILLPLGEAYGGPLFFEQYSFLGINPSNLTDAYADYHIQTINHSRINHEYCTRNPKKYYGYSALCWGLTASDINDGYTASSPTHDVGVIAPTAAVSSLPFTPEESLQALNFFYYILGDKLWGQYGFIDAFSLNNIWFADSYLAIDQGPQIGMIENYRTGLLWDLFMSAPEVQTGLTKLGFSY